MKERDRLVDDILAEIQANRGVTFEKRSATCSQDKNGLIDEILAESAYKPDPSVLPVVPEQANPPGKPAKKVKKEEPEDLLASITPWKERHAVQRGLNQEQIIGKISRKEEVSQMAGVKNTQDFFSTLKKSKKAPADLGDELLYKKSGAVYPKIDNKPLQKDVQLKDVSTGEWEASLTQATRQITEVYEPTRMVPTASKMAGESTLGKTAHFQPWEKTSSKEITGQVRFEGFDPVQTKPSDEWEDEFISGRQDKIKQFKMNVLTEDAEVAESAEDEGEYRGVEDAASMKYDLLARRRYVTVRLWLTLILLIPTLMLTLVNVVDLTNGLLSDNPVLLLSLYGGVLLATLLLHLRTLFGGFVALFRGGDRDTPAALAMFVSLMQVGVMAAATDNLASDFANSLVGGAALLALVLNLAGKRLLFTRMYRNLELIGNDRMKSVVTTVTGRDEAFELGRGLAVGMPKVAYACQTVTPKRFMYHSYAPDRAELSARAPLLLSLLFGLMGGLLAFFFVSHSGVAQGVIQTVTGFCGGVMAGLPMTVLLSGNLPLNQFSRSLWQRKIMLSGYDAVEEFEDTDVLALDAASLFPAGSIRLKSIKSATNQSLDRSIMDVAGVVYMADSPLKPLFESILQGRSSLLPEVDTLVYEEEMGISGWVMGYRVLVGTKKLMENHGVQLPDIEYEDPYRFPGMRAVYLSTQGILSAVFLVEYSPDPDVAEALKRAVRSGLGLHIYSCDPNVTRELVCKMFHLPSASVRIMSAVPRRIYKQQCEQSGQSEAVLTYEGNGGDFCYGVVSSMKLRRVIRFAALLQTLFSLLGAVLFCVFLYLLGGVSGGAVWLYQLISCLFILGLPKLMGR